MEQPIIKVSNLFQAGIVVRDIEKSMEEYKKIFGIDPWVVMEINSDTMIDLTYKGKPSLFSFKIALAKLGEMQIELLQPVEGDNIYSDFLEEHGEGLHHLGHVRVDDIDEALEALEKAGFPCIQSGRSSFMNYAYVDMTSILGYVVELTSGEDFSKLF